MYIHSKGVTKLWDTISDWRKCMEFFLVDNADICLNYLYNNYDTVGIMKHPTHIFPHYSGNFWWSTGKYLSNLFKNHTIGNEYCDTEMFLFLNNPKDHDMFPVWKVIPNYNGYINRLPEIIYKNYIKAFIKENTFGF